MSRKYSVIACKFPLLSRAQKLRNIPPQNVLSSTYRNNPTGHRHLEKIEAKTTILLWSFIHMPDYERLRISGHLPYNFECSGHSHLRCEKGQTGGTKFGGLGRTRELWRIDGPRHRWGFDHVTGCRHSWLFVGQSCNLSLPRLQYYTLAKCFCNPSFGRIDKFASHL